MSTTQLYTATLTAANIIDAVSRETRGVLDSTVTRDQTILLDYLSRVQLQVLRASKWEFSLSEPKYFVTEREQTDYWIGATASLPAGVVDTGLNLTDLDQISKGSVKDVTNNLILGKMDAPPLLNGLSYKDASFRPGTPLLYRFGLSVPGILSLYPAPDNQNTYQPVPETPYLTTSTSGALSARTYYVKTTFVDSLGNEGTASIQEGLISVPANKVLVVHSPVLAYTTTSQDVTYSQYRTYVSTTTGGEQLQATTTYGSNWTEPTTGLISGVTPPTTSLLTAFDGYLMSFRYTKQRQLVSATADVLQVPNVYKDVLVDGVCMMAFKYLKLKDEAMDRQQSFMSGLRQLVHDRNLTFDTDFIHPDPTS